MASKGKDHAGCKHLKMNVQDIPHKAFLQSVNAKNSPKGIQTKEEGFTIPAKELENSRHYSPEFSKKMVI